MICLAVYRNDVFLCHAGIANASLLSVIVAGGLRADDPASFHVAGLQDLPVERSAHVYWIHETALAVGDRLRFSLVRNDTPTLPIEIKATDSPEYLQEQREFEEFEKTYAGPEPRRDVRWTALEWRLKLRDHDAPTARPSEEDEHLMCSINWDKWRPERCRIHVRSFPGGTIEGHRRTKDWLRDVIQIGESFEMSVYA